MPSPTGRDPSEPSLLSVRDLAKKLGVSERMVRHWRDEGKLPLPIEVGGLIRWLALDVDDWIEEQRDKLWPRS